MGVRRVVIVFSCFVILCVGRHSILALTRQCYQCDSCNDSKPDSFRVTTCGASCMKWSGVNSNNARMINRGCLDIDGTSFKADNDNCMTAEMLGFKGQLCVCNNSKCNGANTVTKETFTLLLPLVTLLAVMRM